MQILPTLALLMSGHLCYGHTTQPIDAVAAEQSIKEKKAKAVEDIVSRRRALAALHQRAEALSKSNALRLMMALPMRVPPASMQYFRESYPTMPTAHVFVPLMQVAQMEVDVAQRLGLGVALVQKEMDYLIALAELGLEDSSVASVRRVTDRLKPVLGGGFAIELIQTLAELKAESPDANVVLPPLFKYLAGHLHRGLKSARRLTRNEVEAKDVRFWLNMPNLKPVPPRFDQTQADLDHSRAPAPLSQISREFAAAGCNQTLEITSAEAEDTESIGTTLQHFTER